MKKALKETIVPLVGAMFFVGIVMPLFIVGVLKWAEFLNRMFF